MQIFIHKDNQQLGPFTEAEVKAKLASGAITLQDHAWWEGQSGWAPLGQTPLAAGTLPTEMPPQSGVFAPITQSASSASGGKTSNLALWSLICGCFSLLCGIFTAIPAIILGHKGLAAIKKDPTLQGGGMALAGLIIGYFTLGLMVISLIAITILIALGNQVKDTFKTIESQTTTSSSTQNSQDSTSTPDESTNSPSATTTSADQTTNAADQTTNSSDQSTNAPDAGTNAAPMSQ